jgi:uncharacterized protein
MKDARRNLLTTVGLLLAACAPSAPSPPRAPAVSSPLTERLVRAAVEQTSHTRHYDPSYVEISYPGGDVPLETGVCSDVIVRAFRGLGIDLQREVHEDMHQNFSAYPDKWGLAEPDPNIDHRRVPNLMTYFERKGTALGATSRRADYRPGDIVAWSLGGGLLHIGVVSDTRSEETGNYKIVHNIGAGAKLDDVPFSWETIGHYRPFNP